MSRGLTAAAIAAQPSWLRALRVDARLPEAARVLFTGCGTSFHAALAAGPAAHALDVVLGDAPSADALVRITPRRVVWWKGWTSGSTIPG